MLRKRSLPFVLFFLGCSSQLPAPEHVRHVREAYLPVPYPPRTSDLHHEIRLICFQSDSTLAASEYSHSCLIT